MIKPKIAIASTILLGLAAVLFIVLRPVQTQVTQQTPLPTRDTATINTNGDLMTAPVAAMLVGTQGSSSLSFRARPLVACDRNAFKNLSGNGTYGLAAETGKSVYVCSYSISNGSSGKTVQFVNGVEASSGSGSVCNPGDQVSAKYYLSPNQFVSQGSGVGVLFTVFRQGLCLRVTGSGDVGVNVSYATF